MTRVASLYLPHLAIERLRRLERPRALPEPRPAPLLPVDDDLALDDAIARCRRSFDEWQPLIRAMVDSNGPEARLRTLGIVPAR